MEGNLVRLKRPKDRIEDINYEAFCQEVEVVLHVSNLNEYNAALTFMDAPDVEGECGEGKATTYPIDPKVTNVLGMFGKKKMHYKKAALVMTLQGKYAKNGIEDAIKKYPTAKCILGVGVCYSFWKQTVAKKSKHHQFADVLVSSACMENVQFTTEGIENRGQVVLTHENLRLAFCTEDKYKWDTFKVSKEGRCSKYYVGTILSYDALFKDARWHDQFHAGGHLDDIIGGEMEGQVLAGMQQNLNVPIVVVKAVVDYGDNDKGDHWQFTGAMAAFDYTATSLENLILT